MSSFQETIPASVLIPEEKLQGTEGAQSMGKSEAQSNANSSGQVSQLKSMQESANQSTQMLQLKTLQDNTNQGADHRPPIQASTGFSTAQSGSANAGKDNSGVVQRNVGIGNPFSDGFAWPLTPGKVRFSGIPANMLSSIAVIPEDGNTHFFPENGTWYESDGLWFEGRSDAWYKIPDHASAEVTYADGSFSIASRVHALTSLVKDDPGWSTDNHAVGYPF